MEVRCLKPALQLLSARDERFEARYSQITSCAWRRIKAITVACKVYCKMRRSPEFKIPARAGTRAPWKVPSPRGRARGWSPRVSQPRSHHGTAVPILTLSSVHRPVPVTLGASRWKSTGSGSTQIKDRREQEQRFSGTFFTRRWINSIVAASVSNPRQLKSDIIPRIFIHGIRDVLLYMEAFWINAFFKTIFAVPVPSVL